MARKKNEKIKVIRKLPGQDPEEIEIPNTLEAIEKEIGGNVMAVGYFNNATFLCNSTAWMSEKPNFYFAGFRFFGTVLLVGTKGKEFTDVWISAGAARFFMNRSFE